MLACSCHPVPGVRVQRAFLHEQDRIGSARHVLVETEAVGQGAVDNVCCRTVLGVEVNNVSRLGPSETVNSLVGVPYEEDLFLVQAGLREEPVDLALGEVLALIDQEGGTVLRRVQ